MDLRIILKTDDIDFDCLEGLKRDGYEVTKEDLEEYVEMFHSKKYGHILQDYVNIYIKGYENTNHFDMIESYVILNKLYQQEEFKQAIDLVKEVCFGVN